VLLYIVVSQRFSFHTSTFDCGMPSPISYNLMVSFAFSVFIRHAAHCFLLLVSCMLYARSGQTSSVYEPQIVKHKLQRAETKII